MEKDTGAGAYLYHPLPPTHSDSAVKPVSETSSKSGALKSHELMKDACVSHE